MYGGTGTMCVYCFVVTSSFGQGDVAEPVDVWGLGARPIRFGALLLRLSLMDMDCITVWCLDTWRSSCRAQSNGGRRSSRTSNP